MMIRPLFTLIVALFVYTGAATFVSAEDLHFAGDQNADTAAFEMDGPWLLDWSARGSESMSCNLKIWQRDTDERVRCTFELRLVDAVTGRLLGTITELVGEGHGYKLFEEPGRYRIQVLAQDIRWDLNVSPVTEETAARLKAGPTMADRSHDAASRVPAGSFVSWRPQDDETLLLFAEGEATGYRVTFSPACAGLSRATGLSFVTAMENRVEVYDSILLDNGRQCWFDQVIPTIFN